MLNKDLLGRTISHIENHPEEHEQKTFVTDSGTAYCFTGHAASKRADVPDVGFIRRFIRGFIRGFEWGRTTARR